MDEIKELKQKIDELKRWKEQDERQQLKFPIDFSSKKSFDRNFFAPTGIQIVPTGLLVSPFVAIEVLINGQKYWLRAAGKY